MLVHVSVYMCVLLARTATRIPWIDATMQLHGDGEGDR
jgi:hypothetical protein